MMSFGWGWMGVQLHINEYSLYISQTLAHSHTAKFIVKRNDKQTPKSSFTVFVSARLLAHYLSYTNSYSSVCFLQ